MTPLAPYFFPTDHTLIRSQQRAISRDMLQAVLAFGSERRDGIFMTRRDCLALACMLAEDLRVLVLQQRQPCSLGHARFAKSAHASKQNQIRGLKHLIPVLQRCEGIYVPTDGCTIITVQRLGPSKKRDIFLEKRKPQRQPSREDLGLPPHLRRPGRRRARQRLLSR